MSALYGHLNVIKIFFRAYTFLNGVLKILCVAALVELKM